MDYLLSKGNIILEVADTNDRTKKPKSIGIVFKNTAILTSMFFVLCFLILHSLGSTKPFRLINKNYEKSFYITYNANDYNDSSIIFYNKEIEKSSRVYIEANNDYALFEASIEKQFGLMCIETLLANHTKSDNIYKLSNAFSKNSRNKYVDTRPLIEKYKKNNASLERRDSTSPANIIGQFYWTFKKEIFNRC